MSPFPVQPCPRCHASDPAWTGRGHIDGRMCQVCGSWSSNTEISRGVPWTEDEIEEMRRGMSASTAATTERKDT